MATLYVTECAQMGYTHNGQQLVMAPMMPPVAEQKLTITTTSTASTTFNALTTFVLVEADATCSLAWTSTSVTVSATTSAQRIGAGESRFYSVYPGGTISVVSNS